MSLPSDREESIFSTALALPTADRTTYLEKACEGDLELFQRLAKLLRAHANAGSFLETPMVVTREDLGGEAPGNWIGHYKLVKKIGEGGCGIVYLAEQEEPVRRSVALKIIKLGMDTKEVVARFEVERQALAMMDHPNIARVFDAGATHTGRPFFVMEWVQGIKITDYCDQSNVSLEERLRLFVQVCHAIQHAHQKGIIHRDIKPSNVMVTLHDGLPVPKVIDFGVAKATQGRLTDRTLFTAFEQFIGTPAYMSPEQAGNRDGDVDTRSDLYSLGVLLYELLTGCTPLDTRDLLAAGMLETRRRIIEVDPPRPSTRLHTLQADTLSQTAKNRRTDPPRLIKLVHGDLDWVVMRCLEKDRRRRYETAAGLATEIQRYLNNEPIEARPPSTFYSLKKFARRHRAGFLASMIVAGSLIAVTVVSVWLATRALRAEKWAQTEAATSQAISKFLQNDLLAQASPDNEPDRELKLRAVLDRAAQKVEGQFAEQPLVEAALRDTLAETYASLGEYRLAREQWERDLELRRKWQGPENPKTLSILTALTDMLRLEGKYHEAEILGSRALEIHRRVLGPDHPDTTLLMAHLALVLGYQGKLAEEEAMLVHTLTIRRRSSGDENEITLSALNDLAQVYRAEGKLAEAENVASQELSSRRRLSGEDHPKTLVSMLGLAIVYEADGKYSEAREQCLQAYERAQKVLGKEHPDTVTMAGLLAQIASDEGKYPEAELLATQVLELRRRALGPESPFTLSGMNNLAVVLVRSGKLAEAETLNKQTLEIRSRVYGAENFDAVHTMYYLAEVYQLQGRLDEATNLAGQALEIAQRVLKPEHPVMLKVLDLVGTLALQQGRAVQAEKSLSESYALRLRTMPTHWKTSFTKSWLGEALTDLQRFAEAETLLIQSYEEMKRMEEKIPASFRPEIQKAGARIEMLYTKWSKPAKIAEWQQRLRADKAGP